jgi:2-polyprenyl-6-methoxyphenol hydroxylase-like FAD-dependent oxidoreductase
MRAIIVGAGIGGPAAAVALQRAGLEVVLCETLPQPAEHRGLFLGLGVNGMRVLGHLDLLHCLDTIDTIPTPLMSFYSTTGKKLGAVSNGWLDSTHPSVTVMRGALHQALAVEAQKRGVEVIYGKTFKGILPGIDGVVVQFDDGTELQGDLLVGADGLWSRVRGAMGMHARPAFTGLLNIGGTASTSLAPTVNEMQMIWGKRAFFGYTVRASGEAWWFANIAAKEEPEHGELGGTSETAWRTRLQELFIDDHSAIIEILKSSGKIGAYPIYDMPALPAWTSGRIALIGDAAHAASPSSGQGASMALEDAITIGKCVRDLGVNETALRRFVNLRRARAERIVAEGRKRGQYKAPSGRMALFFRDLLMPMAMKVFANDASLAWIYDHDIPWSQAVGQDST